MLEWALDGATSLGINEVYISGSDATPKKSGKYKLLVDRYPGCGPLAGIFEGLCNSSKQKLVVVPCDVPFLDFSILARMLPLAEEHSIVIPSDGNYSQPLIGVYSKNCIPFIGDMLKNGKNKVSLLFEMVDVAYVSTRMDDPSFFNINSPEDYEKALQWYSEAQLPISEC